MIVIAVLNKINYNDERTSYFHTYGIFKSVQASGSDSIYIRTFGRKFIIVHKSAVPIIRDTTTLELYLLFHYEFWYLLRYITSIWHQSCNAHDEQFLITYGAFLIIEMSLNSKKSPNFIVKKNNVQPWAFNGLTYLLDHPIPAPTMNIYAWVPSNFGHSVGQCCRLWLINPAKRLNLI